MHWGKTKGLHYLKWKFCLFVLSQSGFILVMEFRNLIFQAWKAMEN